MRRALAAGGAAGSSDYGLKRIAIQLASSNVEKLGGRLCLQDAKAVSIQPANGLLADHCRGIGLHVLDAEAGAAMGSNQRNSAACSGLRSERSLDAGSRHSRFDRFTHQTVAAAQLRMSC